MTTGTRIVYITLLAASASFAQETRSTIFGRVLDSQNAVIAGNAGGNDWSIDGVPNMGNGYSAAYLPYSTTIRTITRERSAARS